MPGLPFESLRIVVPRVWRARHPAAQAYLEEERQQESKAHANEHRLTVSVDAIYDLSDALLFWLAVLD